ncbi:inositol monophosphatase family protein [Chelativorans sp. AA-79]|uniref:inositol monophosphatase family protein n=1 Tax=Chelativorans sp. AA-79 TaxID=3028735 RepID=UPI0023F74E12|nr:inositol monophosphatase family protein [Chelativorans sp. AA-79]WEX11968.1 inositol monophosphatase family protein [Chelativorans sp. AA-79]
MSASDPAIVARLGFARDLARTVGREAEAFRRTADPASLSVSTKSLQDFVTVADRRAEDSIRSALAHAFPEDGFLGEETGGAPAASGYWVVDPIDGTSNYIRGLRHWGVSIAFVREGVVRIGCVFDAASGSVYSAALGGGAYCEDQAISASTRSVPEEALAILGYSRRTSHAAFQATVARLHALGFDYRRLGSASIGLVRVAAGVVDLYYEAHVNCWDVLAGALIATEAGAEARMPPLERMVTEGGMVAVAAPGLARRLSFLAA